MSGKHPEPDPRSLSYSRGPRDPIISGPDAYRRRGIHATFMWRPNLPSGSFTGRNRMLDPDEVRQIALTLATERIWRSAFSRTLTSGSFTS
jgi:hypothetical protein